MTESTLKDLVTSDGPNTWTVGQYLSQGLVWMTSRRETGYVPIHEMDAAYRAQAALWLERHAMPLIMLTETEMHSDVIYGEGSATLSGILDLVAQNPKTWIRTTSLYKALTLDAPNDR
jgi:hypothetical protein